MQELNPKKECYKSLLVHKLILKLKRVVKTVRTTKEEGRTNMEEGMMNGVETTTKKEVQARTKRKRRGKRWRKKSFSKKGQEIHGVFKEEQTQEE
jgi:hypothetical protein